MQVIKEEAKRAGLEHLAADIARQIKPTVRYTPMNCDQATGGQQGALSDGFLLFV